MSKNKSKSLWSVTIRVTDSDGEQMEVASKNIVATSIEHAIDKAIEMVKFDWKSIVGIDVSKWKLFVMSSTILNAVDGEAR